MQPKFQSSFIPKGPIAGASSMPLERRVKEKSLFGFFADVIFFITLIASVAVFGYKFFLKAEIGEMSQGLVAAQARIEDGSVDEILRLNDRLVYTSDLLRRHTILSPLFEYLEASTLSSVRFSDFNFAHSDKGVSIQMRGEATSYAAVALQADTFKESTFLENPTFSNLSLDERGNVTFALEAVVSSEHLSYSKILNSLPAQTQIPQVATTTSTSSSASQSSSTSTPTSNSPTSTSSLPRI